jgi:NACHT domain
MLFVTLLYLVSWILTSGPLAFLDPVPDAVYDSINAVSGCMAGTRREVIGRIIEWIDGRSDQSIAWLYGAAGSGKSAISKSVAELCAGVNRLGASFFFIRGAGRRSRFTSFIPTLVYHLAFSVPATKSYIENVLRSDPHITHRSLERQFRKLIIEPIQSVDPPIPPTVIIIDALDECEDKENIADFIDIVARALRDDRLAIRFLFTSRVEDHIQKKFLISPAIDMIYHLNLEEFNANHDIRTFFQSRFSTIYQENRRLMSSVSHPWPSDSVLTELVAKSSGSFIFAFTLVNFVKDGSDLPHRKLEAALQGHTGLDPLYAQVLRTTPRSVHFVRTFETIMTARERLSVADVAYLLQIDTGDVIHALLGVQSILIVPEDDISPIRPFHTSLRDFLTTRARSHDLFINPSVRHLSIASDCLAVMVVHNGYNILEHKQLAWACRMWSHYLLYAIRQQGSDDSFFSRQNVNDFMEKLIDFASQSFDFWVDSIILECVITPTLDILNSVASELEVSPLF